MSWLQQMKREKSSFQRQRKREGQRTMQGVQQTKQGGRRTKRGELVR